MKIGKEFKFALCVLLCGIFLHLFTYDEEKVGLSGLERMLRLDSQLNEAIAAHCHSLIPTENQPAERFFIEKFSPRLGEPATKRCQVKLDTKSQHRFFLRSHWVTSVTLVADDGPFFQKTYHGNSPKPLCLLPFAIFLFALIFDLRILKFTWLVVSYLFLLAGGNVIQMTELVWKSVAITVTSDPSFIGFSLVILWLAINKSAPNLRPVTRIENNVWEQVGNRLSSLVIGLWNPGFYTVLGRFLFPFRAEVSKLLLFLNSQVLVACLSLYLLSFEFTTIGELASKNILIPRYFSFTILLFFAMNAWGTRSRRQVVLWHFPHFWRALLFVVGAEILAYTTPYLHGLSTLTRAGLALVASELVWPSKLSSLQFAKNFLPWFSILLVAFCLPVIAYQAGLTDLLGVLCDPKVHPNSFVLFTFIAGTVAAFFTGSFSMTLFALYGLLTAADHSPLVRAALLDGILAGSLLSPFSIYNLLPSVQFGLDLRELIACRFQQLAYPLLIGSAIFAVSMIQSVSILRPLTFVFLFMLAVAFQLKKSQWIISQSRFWLNARNDPS